MAQSSKGSSSLTATVSMDSACAFTHSQPRYAVTTVDELLVWNAQDESPQSIFLNDALLRAVTQQLGLQQCQVELTEGSPCNSALAEAACPDPMWLCGGEVTITDSVYEAARSGVCDGSSGGDALVCQTLQEYPAISDLVAGGSCEPACFAQLIQSGGQDTLAAPAPAPSSVVDGCFSFSLAVAAASQEDASTVAASLNNATTKAALSDLLGPFANPNSTITVTMGDTGGGSAFIPAAGGRCCGLIV